MKLKIKTFFTSNILLKLLSVVLGFLLWALLSNNQDPIVTKVLELPISYVNADLLLSEEDLVFLSGPDTFSISVSTRSSKEEQITASMFSCTADLTDHIGGDMSNQRIHVNVSQLKGSDLILDWTYVRSDPNITVSMDEYISKTFPVQLLAEDDLVEGLYLDGVIAFYPETITISGPSSSFGSISSVKAPVRLSTLTDNNGGIISADVLVSAYDANDKPLSLGNDLSMSQTTVNMNATLHRMQTIDIVANEVTGTPAEGYRFVSATVNPSQIVVQGLRENIQTLSEIEIPAEWLDVTDINKKTTFKFDISSLIPDNVILVSTQTIVSVVVDIELWTSQEITINEQDIKLIGEDAKYEYVLGKLPYSFFVKGFKEDLVFVSAAKFLSSVDVSDLEPGLHYIPITLKEVEGCVIAESDSTFEISIEVSETEEEPSTDPTTETSTTAPTTEKATDKK